MKMQSKHLRILQERKLTGLSNNAKWNELLVLLSPLAKRLAWRVKTIDSDVSSEFSRWITPVPNCLEVQSWGPVPFQYVEWLDVKPIELIDRGRLVSPTTQDHSELITKSVSQVGMEYSNHEENPTHMGVSHLSLITCIHAKLDGSSNAINRSQ